MPHSKWGRTKGHASWGTWGPFEQHPCYRTALPTTLLLKQFARPTAPEHNRRGLNTDNQRLHQTDAMPPDEHSLFWSGSRLVHNFIDLEQSACEILYTIRHKPNGTEWYWMVPNDTEWYRMKLNGTEWHWNIPNETERYQLKLNGTEWYWMVPNET